uniref:AC9 transposase n=1 Tax=Cajanus cajan TaxID=3821 RepID=A0A151TFN4_CAJCA|nr:Putative AC9 transposase [Cajanus cajan]
MRNVSTITVDNASTNDVVVSYLKKRIKNLGGLVMDGQFFHMRCCAHILNLVMNDGLRDVHKSIASIKTTIRFVRSVKFKECVKFSRIGNINNINKMLYFGVIFYFCYKLEFVDWSFKEMYLDDAIVHFENLFQMYDWYKTNYEKENKFAKSSHGTLCAFYNDTSVFAKNPSYLTSKDAFKKHLRESCFIKCISIGGRVLDTFRSTLNPQIVEAFICGQNWLRSTITQFKDLNIIEEFEISEKIIKGIKIIFFAIKYL